MNRRRWAMSAWCCLVLFCCGMGAWGIPSEMTISGRLLDQNGNAVHYYKTVNTPWGPRQEETSVNLDAKIYFYDSATTITSFFIQAVKANAGYGYFGITFQLPNAAVVKDSLWYSLAIDIDQNGLTSADNFTDRFEIGSVPFALSAKPQHSFTTHGGWILKGAGFNSMRYGANPQNKMMVAPFETPPGGIEFNQMNIVLMSGGNGNAFSFGIYDQSGKLVVSSGLITIKNVTISEAFLQVKHKTIKLQPSTVYYTAESSNSSDGVTFCDGIKPVAPNFGIVDIPAANGQIPASFDPGKVDPQTRAVAMPITLIFNSTTNKPENGWLGKPGGPQYRWIISDGQTNQK